MSAKELTRVAVLAAILYCIYFLGSFFMYVELVGFIVLLYGVSLNKKTAYLAALVFTFLVMLTRGIAPWSFMYVVVFPQYTLIYHFLSKLTKSEYIYAIVGFILSFMTGTIIEIPYILMTGMVGQSLITYLILGFQVSLGNAACTFLATLFLLKPLRSLLQKVNK